MPPSASSTLIYRLHRLGFFSRRVLQVSAFGGPQPESTVEYSIADSSISSVSSNGLITALALGDTRVIGKAVGLDAVTGEKIVYSQVGRRRILLLGLPFFLLSRLARVIYRVIHSN